MPARDGFPTQENAQHFRRGVGGVLLLIASDWATSPVGLAVAAVLVATPGLAGARIETMALRREW